MSREDVAPFSVTPSPDLTASEPGSETLAPVLDRVFVIPDDKRDREIGGIILPGFDDEPFTATVEAVGPLVTACRAGDRIVFQRNNMYPLRVLGGDKYVVHERDVYALLG